MANVLTQKVTFKDAKDEILKGIDDDRKKVTKPGGACKLKLLTVIKTVMTNEVYNYYVETRLEQVSGERLFPSFLSSGIWKTRLFTLNSR